ncbi:hypothetical protein ACFDTO_21150 [Microbacteriaceae bacterium 4G12]
MEEQKHIYLHLSDESVIELPSSMFGIDYEKLTDLINGIINETGEEKSYVTTSQMLPLASMDHGIKDAYIKIICNFVYSDDDMIDSKEYAEIILLIVRIDYNHENRLKIRSYMCDPSEMEEIKNGLETSKKIEKLSTILSMMSKGAQATTQKINYAESESVISHLPKILDMTTLEELTSEPMNRYKNEIKEQKENTIIVIE